MRNLGDNGIAVSDVPTPRAILDPVDQARTWFRTYLTREHRDLGRRGAVCPFVTPADRAGAISVERHDGLAGASFAALRDFALDVAESFASRDWGRTNENLRSVVAVMPGLDETDCEVLDDVQRVLKPVLAVKGLAMGQFHPYCDERAARNSSFRVSISPLAMIVIRNMALHDILFVHHDPKCFAEYDKRFGHRFRSGGVADRMFVECYERAVGRWPHGETPQ